MYLSDSVGAIIDPINGQRNAIAHLRSCELKGSISFTPPGGYGPPLGR